MVADATVPMSTFVSRVTALPTVGAALDMAVNSYNKLKEVSPGPIKSFMEVGEATTQVALSTTKPIIDKLHGPIQFVDSLACQGLDRVEERVPAVKETPEKILADVKDFSTAKVMGVRDSMLGYGNQKLQQFGFPPVVPERFGEYREQLVGYAAVALAAAEGALDSHLAANGAEVPKFGGENDLYTRMEHLTTKARLCVAHHTTSRFVAAQKAASESMTRVVEALSVIRALKDNVREGKSVQEIAQTLHFDWLSSLLKEAQDKPAAQQALFVAQAAAHEAHEALKRAQDGVKTKLTDTYSAVLNRAGELTSALQSTSVTQLTNQLMTNLTSQAQHLQDLIRHITGLNLKQYLPELKNGVEAQSQKVDQPAEPHSGGDQ